VFENSLNGVIVFDHFLVVAPALFVGTGADELAHDSVEVPFSPLLSLPLNNFSELEQELDVFLVLGFVPVRSGILLLCWRGVI
jgi:hypothetical protein